MRTTLFKYTSLGLNAFLVFCLIFKNKLQLPELLVFAGKFHPVVLHLPIGVLFVYIFLRYLVKSENIKINLSLILGLFAVSTAVSALLGLFLGQNSEEGGLLSTHRNWGVILSVLSFFAFWTFEKWHENKLLSNTLNGLLCIVLFAVGHQGGSITHGEDFLSISSSTKDSEVKTELQSVFSNQIMPIFKDKCVQCHNDSKTKGSLNMSTIAKLLKGGKNGPIWKAGDPTHSTLIIRALLPLEHKEHMPPKGKKQLSSEEIDILNAWINEGGKTDQKYSELSATSHFVKYTPSTTNTVKEYTFSEASTSTIDKINSPFLNLKPIAYKSPALKASFFVRANFDKKGLELLKDVKEQLVAIDLSKMPVNDDVFEKLSYFPNLESINLNQTDITGKGIDKLLACKNLKALSLSNTKIDKNALKAFLQKSPPLQVYLWASNIDPQAIKLDKHKFNFGYEPNNAEKLTLNTPTLLNDNFWFSGSTKIKLSHTLKGVNIKYSLNNEPLDSAHGKPYTQPILIDYNTTINVLAEKEGWSRSAVSTFQFFKSNFIPDRVKVNSAYSRFYGNDPQNVFTDRLIEDTGNFRSPKWMAFVFPKFFDYEFEFIKPISLNEIIVSSLTQTYDRILPPESIDVYVKTQANQKYVKVTSFKPKQPTEHLNNKRNPIIIAINTQKVTSVKIVAKPSSKFLPFVKANPKEKPFLFLDEVFFY